MTNPRSHRWSAADELLAELHGRALADETADHLAGRARVTVWHGETETAEDARLIEALAEKISSFQQAWPGCVVLTQGGNDYRAVKFQPVPGAPAADVIADTFAEFAESIAPQHPALDAGTWWRITRNAPTAGPPHWRMQ